MSVYQIIMHFEAGFNSLNKYYFEFCVLSFSIEFNGECASSCLLQQAPHNTSVSTAT